MHSYVRRTYEWHTLPLWQAWEAAFSHMLITGDLAAYVNLGVTKTLRTFRIFWKTPYLQSKGESVTQQCKMEALLYYSLKLSLRVMSHVYFITITICVLTCHGTDWFRGDVPPELEEWRISNWPACAICSSQVWEHFTKFICGYKRVHYSF